LRYCQEIFVLRRKRHVYTLRETVYYDAGFSIHRLCELRRGCGCYSAVSAFLAIRHDNPLEYERAV